MSTESAGTRVNPRVQRTRANALAVAREILLDGGPAALTYTSLSDRSGLTRQTLYRHWHQREALLADVILTGPDVGYPSAGPDARQVMIEFLTSLRAGLSDTATAAALLTIAAQAGQDPDASDALSRIFADRRAALNLLLEQTPVTLDPTDYLQVAGPVITQLLIGRQPVSDYLIADTVDAWLARGQH
ncbi:TetR/AcrR family transcriptional regulator [Subtercola sp. PAMC28395]|uniref:TetR/AcrR family transcriptional regulator n=1 Tax=Subtercola sp. PAMC28395 TaxID=2846775 RepID=UPI001C0B828A|nr:TetR/AcrR family transcriptional regulator [Subtercola sp. PAMC28395]QWT24225.1 TetR/AcrR family transcriptional regulator [Subtercola sp. PAMC28395]